MYFYFLKDSYVEILEELLETSMALLFLINEKSL